MLRRRRDDGQNDRQRETQGKERTVIYYTPPPSSLLELRSADALLDPPYFALGRGQVKAIANPARANMKGIFIVSSMLGWNFDPDAVDAHHGSRIRLPTFEMPAEPRTRP